MNAWDFWKKGFDVWENATAKYIETVMRSPLVLGPAGAAMSAVMKSKAAVQGAVAEGWAAVGVPTRRDQERALHALNQIQSRLIDLEERLADLQASQAAALAGAPKGDAAASTSATN